MHLNYVRYVKLLKLNMNHKEMWILNEKEKKKSLMVLFPKKNILFAKKKKKIEIKFSIDFLKLCSATGRIGGCFFF